jgi:putative transposase
MQQGVTTRRVCHIMGVSTSMLYYTPAPDRNAELRGSLRAVVRPGIGYRMARALVLPTFGVLNHKRVYRLWKQEQLACKSAGRSGAAEPKCLWQPRVLIRCGA